MRKIILAVVVVILGFIGYMAYYLGYFLPVEISDETTGPFHLLAKAHTGAYHKIVPVIEEVEKWGKSHGFKCNLTFGHYIDDPTKVEEERLRSEGGCIVNEHEAPLDDLPEGFSLKELPAGLFVKAIFQGSPGIGPFKVYPMLTRHIEEKQYKESGWGVLEVYEVHGPTSMTTTYYFPVTAP